MAGGEARHRADVGDDRVDGPQRLPGRRDERRPGRRQLDVAGRGARTTPRPARAPARRRPGRARAAPREHAVAAAVNVPVVDDRQGVPQLAKVHRCNLWRPERTWSWTNGSIAAFTGPVQWLAIIGIGAVVGFLGGLFGKGGSAIATPLLAAVGIPPIIAVASPLPATIPGTLVAYRRYRRLGHRRRRRHPHEHPRRRPGHDRRRPRDPLDRRRLPRHGHRRRSSLPSASSSLLWPAPTEVVRDDIAHRRARTIARRRRRRPARRAARQRRRLPPRPALPGRAQAADQDRAGLLVGRRQRPRPARHDRPRRPRPHRLDGDARVRHWRRSRCRATAPAVALRMRADRLERIYGGGLAVLGFVLLAGSLI